MHRPPMFRVDAAASVGCKNLHAKMSGRVLPLFFRLLCLSCTEPSLSYSSEIRGELGHITYA